MRRWPLLVVVLGMFATSGVAAQDRAFTSGLSVGLGVGHENGGLGGHALYYFQLGERWRIAPHAGVGWLGKTGVTGGVMATFGRRHRLVLDAL